MSSLTEKVNLPNKEHCNEYEVDSEIYKDVLSNKSNKTTKIDLNNLPRLIIYGKDLKLELNYPDEYKAIAENELRETPEVIAESLKIIRQLVKEESDLCVPDEDEFFTKFLRPCKWYPESAFHLMQRYYKFRINYPYMMENLTLMNLKKIICADLLVPIPIRCIDGSRVVLIHCGSKWNPKEYNIYEMIKCLMYMIEGALIEPVTQVTGIQVILDMSGLPFGHVAYVTPRFAAMLAEWIQKCIPCRVKNIHIINQPFIFNMIYAIFKPFLMEKLRKRIHFHGTDREKIINMIGKKALPKEYGGLELYFDPIREDLWNYLYPWEEVIQEQFVYGYQKKK